MTAKDFRTVAELRLAEALRLRDSKCYSGAYYLAGYAVECGLKACVAKQTRKNEFPDKKRVEDAWTHDLNKLLRTARLDHVYQQTIVADKAFESNWAVVKDWKESSRYREWNKCDATNLIAAVQDAQHGVLTWLRKHW